MIRAKIIWKQIGTRQDADDDPRTSGKEYMNEPDNEENHESLTVEGYVNPVGQHDTKCNQSSFNHDEGPTLLGGGTFSVVRWYGRSIQTLYTRSADGRETIHMTHIANTSDDTGYNEHGVIDRSSLKDSTCVSRKSASCIVLKRNELFLRTNNHNRSAEHNSSAKEPLQHLVPTQNTE